MQLEISRPWALLFLPVLAGIVIWFAARYRSRSGMRRIGETLMRCVLLALVLFSLSGISIRKSSDITTTVFLVDLSDSVKSVRSKETEFIQSAIAEMPDKNQAGIVVFGADAQIEQFVSDKKAFTEFQSNITATATNLEQAIQTALAMFPDNSARRLVLLTDGSENEGSVGNLVSSLAGSDIELKVMKYDSYIEKEVYVSSVDVPDTIHQGDQFEVKVDVYSTDAVSAAVSLYSGRTLKDKKEVILQKGNNQLVFSDSGAEGGLKSYRVTVEAEDDTVSVNNTYSAFTKVEARSRLLVVEGKTGQNKAFTEILKACNYNYDVVTPSGVPKQISDMTQYQSIILLDVYSEDLRKGFMDCVETYVKDYAGGLIAIGGKNSFALGKYKNTPLETVLPVNMDLEGEKQVPKLAMAMVIDHSGSMDSPSTERGNINCLDIAKQAAGSALDSLREIDEVGVLAFDDGYNWAVPLQTAVDTEKILSQISGIPIGGGTSIYPALAEAVEKIKESDAVLKHIILLTDGQDGYHEYEDLMKRMEKEGITLSTVAVGAEADSKTLRWLAEQGGGRYYYSDASTALPRIFAQEVYRSVKSYLINEEFTPVIVNSHEITKDIFTEGSPSMLGYIASTPKSTATVLLESDRKDPILSVWQYGLGRTVAWNSDGTNEWTRNFAGWDRYAALWRNIIDWTISKSELLGDTLKVKQEASSAVITYETEDYGADTSISAVITGEDGTQQKAMLKAVSPGVYRAEVPLSEIGVYMINVRNQKGKEIVKNINTAAAMQYSREYRYVETSNSLDDLVTKISGRYITKSDEVFDSDLKGAMSRTNISLWFLFAAVWLFVLDVIMRRMRIDWLAGLVGVWKGFTNKISLKKGQYASGKAKGRRQKEETELLEKAKDLKDRGSEDIRKKDRKTQDSEEQSSGKKDSETQDGELQSSGKRVSELQGDKLQSSGKKDSKTQDSELQNDGKKGTEISAKKKGIGRKNTEKKKSGDTNSRGTIDTAALLKKKKERNL